MNDNDPYQQAMKELSRTQIWEIWQTGNSVGELDGEDARIYNVLQEHPEHAQLWDRLNYASDNEIIVDGVNVVLHIMMHSIVENQIAENNPTAVRVVLRELLRKGVGRHQAIHAIANVLIGEIFLMQRDQRPYDERRYLRELRKVPLEADQWKTKK